jgi:DNA replication protein DnaC
MGRKIRSEFSTERLYNMMGHTYKRMVEKQGVVFVKTENIRAQILKIAKMLTETKRYGLFITGSVGNGKSTLVKVISQIINYLVVNRYFFVGDVNDLDYCAIVNAREMVRIYSRMPDKFDDMMRRSWLIVDDLCEEPKEIDVYGTKCNPFLELLDYRYEHHLPTILVSNLNYAETKQHYDDPRLDDRMKQMFNRITFKDKSFRQ